MSEVICGKVVKHGDSGKWGACYLDQYHSSECATTELIADIMQEIRSKEFDNG